MVKRGPGRRIKEEEIIPGDARHLVDENPF
jgi:hypothetical protein